MTMDEGTMLKRLEQKVREWAASNQDTKRSQLLARELEMKLALRALDEHRKGAPRAGA